MFPDHEEHLQEWMNTVGDRRHGRLTYQAHKYDRAMAHVRPERRRAVDIGAHVGLWSWLMTHDFQTVAAFEPMPAHQECWFENVDQDHALLEPYALGPVSGWVSIATRTPNSSGDTGVEPDGFGTQVEQVTLDRFGFDDVDFIKIDCEGYELFVLQGAVETLRRCKPTVIVEQKPETGGPDRYGIGERDAVDFLVGMGAKLRDGIQGDYILSWD
jgi:FkbM family methyltransferase